MLLLTAATGAWAQDAKHLITATYREQTRSLEQPLPYATTIGELYEAVTGEPFSNLISTMSAVEMPLTGITSRNTSVVSIGEFNGASTLVTVIADGETIINLIFGNYVQALDTGQYHVFKFSSNEQGAHCTGLVTCAALIIVKTYEHTFDKIEKCLIYHVPSGVVKEDFLLTAKKELSINNFNDCIVVFAHPGEKEKYKSSLDLLNNHVLNFKLIDLSNINHSFGMQSDGIIGF